MLNGLNADQLEIIFIVSFDLCNIHFSYRFAAFHGAELLFSSNEYSSLVTWQMRSFQYSSNSYFATRFSVVFSSSDLSKLFGVLAFGLNSYLNLLLNSTSRLRVAKCNAIHSKIL